jgi:enoyl-CoA hydratase
MYAREGAAARITLNRPESRNALSHELVTELRQALAGAKEDPEVRVVVFTGAGAVFCAGGDLKGSFDAEPQLDGYFRRRHLAELLLQLTTLGKPTLARVNGHALGGGLALVAACDLAVAAEGAQFGMPEINVALFPLIVLPFVLRSIPRKAAMELVLTGKRIDAAEAARIGLVNRAVPSGELDQEVERLSGELARKSPIAVRIGLESLSQLDADLVASRLAYLQAQLALLSASEDTREGIAAFREKREPRFLGR